MSLKYIAVKDCILTIIGSVTPGIATITSDPSLTCFALVLTVQKGIYRGVVNVSVSGCTSGTYVQTDPATGSFNITAVKVKADNEFVLRQDDETSSIDIELENSVPPNDIITIPVKVKVSSAGQNKILAN